MANFRKILATLSTVALLSTLVVTTAVSAATYTDVPSDSWAKSYIDNLVELGVFTGEGKFRPAENMSRAEFVKSVVVAAGLQGTTAITFPDVKDGDWFAPYVKTAVANGVISGYANGKFGPNDSLTREQAAKITVNAFDLPKVTPTSPSFSDVKSTDWSYQYVETLVSYGIVSGYGNGKFGPMDSVKREQVAKIVSLALSPAAPVDNNGPEVTGGDLGVSLSSDTPAEMTIPANATAASVFAVDLKAGDKDVTFNGFTVHKKGVGALASGMQAYLYDGNDRLTAGKSLNSSTNNIEFSNVGLMVMAGKTKTVMMKVDIGDTAASGEVQFELVDASSVKSTADAVTGDFPVVSETVGLSATDVGTITIAKNGSVANPKVGEVGVTISKFTLNASTEAAKVSKLGLYITGSISGDDVTNLKLYVAGTTDPLAEVDGVNAKDLAQFILETPYEIEKGGTKSFYVTADMSPGRNADTLKVYIDESTDVESIGATYGFGMAVTKTAYDGDSCTSTAGDCTYSALEGGDITVTSSGPTATDIAVNAKDVHLMDFKIVSVSDITFKNFDVLLTPGSLDATDDDAGLLGDDAVANYTDIKIINVDTGETLMGPVDVTSFKTTDEGTTPIGIGTDGDLSSYIFTDEFSMSAGESLNLALTVDVANDASLSTDTLYGTLALSGTYPQIKDVNNKTLTNSSSLVPASDLTGKTMTVGSASLVTALAAVPVAGPGAHTSTNNPNTFVKGQKALKFVGISAKCGTTSSCKMTDMTLTGYMDADDSGVYAAGTEGGVAVNSYVGSVWVDDGDGNHVAAAKGVSSAGVVTYSSLNYTIPAGKTVILYVIGDLSSSAAATDNVSFALATAGITYEDKDGNSATSTGAVNGTTAPSTYITTSAGGVLTASVDASTPKDSIAVAGTSDVEVARFKFSGTREDFTVKALSIDAYQLGVADADIAEYDNNISSIKIEYTNSAGVSESKTGFLTSGTAQFSGMDLFLKKDDDAVMKVYATLSTIASGASAGEVVQLNLALNNFEALSGSGGETYKGDKLDATLPTLSIGTVSWSDADAFNLDGAQSAISTLGGSTTLVIDQAGAADNQFPVGTLVCIEDGHDCGTDADIYVVTNYATGATEDTITVTLIDDAGGADNSYSDNADVSYSLPGTGYLTATNILQVYETKPTLALASSSPSGSRSVSSSDEAFAFTVAADSHEKVQIRTASDITSTCAIGFDSAGSNNVVPAASTAQAIDGSSCLETLTNHSAGDTIAVFDSGAASGLVRYARMSFWIRGSDDAEFADIKYGGVATATANPNSGTLENALADTDCTAAVAAGTATLGVDTWHYCDVAIDSDTTTQEFMAFELDEATELVGADTVYFDRVILYNDKITMDLSGDDIGTYAEIRTNAANGTLPVTLKESGSTVATGYVYKNTSAASEGGSASVTFFPISGTDSTIEIAKGATKTFTAVLSTSALLDEDASADDPLTFAIDLGTYTGVTVGTPTGDFWWNDTNFSSSTVGTSAGTSYALTTPGIIKWVGQVTSGTLTSNTVKY